MGSTWNEERTMKTRKIVKIDEDKCNGCGLCVPNCAEGAIQIIDGKARLIAENLCDGLGNCLGQCPLDAITIEERPAEEFDPQAVEQHQAQDNKEACHHHHTSLSGGCPGAAFRRLMGEEEPADPPAATDGHRPSRLRQWPVQLLLLGESADLWDDADILLAADCVGFAMSDFHEQFLADGEKALAVACPKLDEADVYVDKLARIFATHDVKSVTVARMEVPCCMGLVQIVKTAIDRTGRDDLAVREVVIGLNGKIQTPAKI
jgi:ferredoxin